jgi:hypothetical protein
MKVAIAALCLLASGCATASPFGEGGIAYKIDVKGDVRGASVLTPAQLRPGVYYLIPEHANPNPDVETTTLEKLKPFKDDLCPLPQASVAITIKAGSFVTVKTIDISARGQFHFIEAGQSKKYIDAVTIRVTEPNRQAIERPLLVENSNFISTSSCVAEVVAILDEAGGAPAPLPTPESLKPPPGH